MVKYARRKFKRRFNRKYKSRRPGRLRFAKGNIHPSRYAKKMAKTLNMFAEKKIASQENGTFSIDIQGDNNIMMPAIIKGTAGNQRVGNKIFVRYLINEMWFRAKNVTNDVTYPYDGMHRVSVIMPKDKTWDALGDMPTNNILQDWDTEKFTVLRDIKFHLVNEVAYSSTTVMQHWGTSNKYMKIQIPWFKCVEYVGDNLVTAMPKIFVWSSHSTSATNKVTYLWKSKCTFTDI